MITLAALASLAIAGVATVATAANPSPNILFILSDDLGYGEPTIYPSGSLHGRIETPHIDALMSSGVHFMSAYAGEAVCAPSRNSLLVGKHTGHTLIRGNDPFDGHDLPLRPEDITIPMVLKDAGYRTAAVGKWALGYNGTTGSPWEKGYQYYFGQLDQSYCHNMYPSAPLGLWEAVGEGASSVVTHITYPQNNNASRAKCMAPGSECVYTHDLFTNKTLELLQQQADAGPRAPPLWLFLGYTDPHAGGWGGVTESGSPVPSDGIYTNESWPNVEKDHASVIHHFQDRDVGRIVDLLRSTGLYNNTLIIFASDNGAHSEGGHEYTFFNSSGPLRGFKRSLYEGGIRVPFSVTWPAGGVPANVTSDHPFAFWDVLPTLADIVGIPPSALPPDIDGVSVRDVWFGGTPATAHPPFYWEFCTVHSNNTDGPTEEQVLDMFARSSSAPATWGHAVRMGDWKGVSFSLGAPLELYDLSRDLGERSNVAAAHPDIVAQMGAFAAAAHEDNPYFPVQNCVGS